MESIRKLFPFVKPYWQWAVTSLVLLTLLVVMDLSIPRLVQRIIDQGVRQKDMNVVLQTSALMLLISVVSVLFALGNNLYSVRAGESVARDLREALFRKILNFSFGNLDQYSTGRLVVRLTSDTSALQRLVQVTLRIGTRAPLLMVGSLILMFATDSRLALNMLPLLLVTAAIVVYFSLKMEPLYRLVQQKLDRLNTVLQENIAGARVVKAFVRAGFEAARFETANHDFTERSTTVTQYVSTMAPILTLFVNLGIVIVIWAGGLQAIEGDITTGQIVAFTNYLMTTMSPLIMMTMLSNVWANGAASARRVVEVLEMISDTPQPSRPLRLPDGARGQVSFEHVNFHYDSGQGGPVLEDITFTAQPGERVAILGATGSGKSTLVNLIPRFYDVTGGRVCIDGVDVRQIDRDSLLEQIAIVPQETILFSGTVRENIRYGRPEAGQDEVEAAAKAAQAHEFILALPEGYDTHIEQRGANLSGGQKQRIAIARALLLQPRILILDDSTSAVDVETETHIQAALEQRLDKSTLFIVAQRISTVLNADKILVLERGKIVAEGPHSELIQSSPVYQEIYASQLGGGVRDLLPGRRSDEHGRLPE